MDGQRAYSMSGVFAHIMREVIKSKRTLVVLLVLSVVAAGLDIVVPIINQNLIDALVKSIVAQVALPVWYLVWGGVGILCVTILGRKLTSEYGYKLFQYAVEIEDGFRDAAYRKYLDLHALYHHSHSSGQTISRIERGAIGIYTIVHDIVGQSLVVPAIYFIAILAILLVKNPWIALLVFVPLPTYLLLIRKWSRTVYEVDRKAHDQFELANKEQHDVAQNVLTVKWFGQEQRERERQRDIRRGARVIQFSAERIWIKMDILQSALSTVGRVSVFIVSGVFVLKHIITIGELTLFLTLQNMVYQPMFQLSVLFPRLRRNMARAERLFEVLDAPVEINDTPGAVVCGAFEKQITFDQVWFCYAPNLPHALKNIRLSIEKGSTVALVGRSGSGKTTFVKLLLRAYDPTRGRIMLDGVDIRTTTQESLRDHFAIVPQEVELLSRSVADNIRYGRPDVSDEEVRRAAEHACAHEFIEELENGYDTIVGERGMKLSGGQRQRIGIARAILKNPSVLIFDEATSHLDTESEQLVQQATDAAMKDRTTIIIAHRLSTVLKADRIVVFDHGGVDAVGAHEELLSKSLIYRRLYELQFEDKNGLS